jgi:3-deoxy-D-manno-octulosonic-acid transferase
MKEVYNISVKVLDTLLDRFGKINPKWEKLVKVREEIIPSLSRFRKDNTNPVAWFHVASLGEYEQAKPVIQELKKFYPKWTMVLTFFSPSGYENVIKKKQPNIDFISYLPFDTTDKAAQFVEILKPQMVFFIKYDLWANFIFTIKKNRIPLFLVSASFRENQIYFRKYGGFFKKVLMSFDHIFTQDQHSLDLLNSISYKKGTLTGDTRFDNVKANSQKPKSFPLIEKFIEDKEVLVVGSAWEEDMTILIPLMSANPQYKYLIAPHEIKDNMIHGWQSRIGIESLKYSELEKKGISGEAVLFIDNIGMLSSLYQYGKFAYVGGAFGKGLHNILEPLAFGIPVFFGKLKKRDKFPESKLSQSYGCGFEVQNFEEMQIMLSELEKDLNYKNARKGAERMVEDNLGSAEKIVGHVQNFVEAT